MRKLISVAIALGFPALGTAQETVAVDLHLTIPVLLQLDVEREDLVLESTGSLTKRVALRVHANSEWTLFVTCGESALQSAEVGDGGTASAPAVQWRLADSGVPFQPCTDRTATPVSQGGRSNAGSVIVEYVAPRAMDPGALRYALAPR